MTTQTEEYKLPNLLKVESATIEIPTRFYPDNIKDYERQQREITHVLALLPDEAKAEADLDEDGLYIQTESVPAIKYANDHYLLSEGFTVIDNVISSVLSHYDGDVCNHCVDNFVEEAMDKDFEIVSLSEGLYIKFAE